MLNLMVNFPLEVKSLQEFPKAPSSNLFFFLLSINDINDVSTVLNLKCLILFAEDTSVFMSHKNLDYHHMINSEMSKLSVWFRENKLSPNLTTKQNLFCLDQAKDVQIVI